MKFPRSGARIARLAPPRQSGACGYSLPDPAKSLGNPAVRTLRGEREVIDGDLERARLRRVGAAAHRVLHVVDADAERDARDLVAVRGDRSARSAPSSGEHRP